MPRSKAYRISCIECGRPRDKVGRLRGDHRVLSAKGLCIECSMRRMTAQQSEAGSPSPEWWDRYRRGVAASVGARIDTESDGGK